MNHDFFLIDRKKKPISILHIQFNVKIITRAGWWNGIHEGLKIPCPKGLVGSNPTPAIHIIYSQIC